MGCSCFAGGKGNIEVVEAEVEIADGIQHIKSICKQAIYLECNGGERYALHLF